MREEIGILGIGKLGICFALNMERVGYHVTGIDINQDYVGSINDKTLRSYEPEVESYLADSQNFTASTDLNDVVKDSISYVFIAVATPSTPDGRYNHSQVDKVVEKLLAFGKRENRVHLVIVCTTMPGYSDQLAEKLAPFNYTVSYNPEFIAQGNIMSDQRNPDQVLIGEADTEAGDGIQKIYDRLTSNSPEYCRMSRLSAEICKIATNCFLTTKISFANSIGDLALKAGAEPDKILQAIGSDSRIGPKYLKYGYGFGGPCFPRDNRALGVFADECEYELLISKATDEVNKRHLDFQYEEMMKNTSDAELIKFDSITYKKGSLLIEESQQLALAVKLAKSGRKVQVEDHPKVIEEIRSLYGDLLIYRTSAQG